MLLSFNFNENFIYILISLILNIIQNFSETQFQKNIEYFLSLIYYISDISLIIFYFIEKYSSKISNQEKDINSFQRNLCNSTIIILIICILIFNSIHEYISFLSYTNQKEEFIFLFLFYILFERFIFKNYFYSHHMVSADIICILFIYYFILNIIQSKLNLSYILFILSRYSLSFSLLLIKYINTIYFINIYLLGSILGIFGTIPFLIIIMNRNLELLKLNIFFIYSLLHFVFNE